MTSTYLFSISFLILFFLYHFANLEELSPTHNLIKWTLRFQRSRSVVLILDEKDVNSELMFLRIQKQLSSTDFYYSALTTLSRFREGLKTTHHTTVVVVNPSRKFIRDLEKVTTETEISHKWLLTTSTLTFQDLENLTIPLHSEFMIAEGNPQEGYNLTEIYDIRPKEKSTVLLGRWVDGEEFSNETDLFKRRKNFKMVAIKVVSAKKDCCDGTSFNVGVAPIVMCIHQKIWDVITEMLNATTEIQVVPNLTVDVIQNTDAELTFRSAPLNVIDLNTRSYVWPIFMVKVEVVTSYLKQEVEWETYLLPFSQQMWLAILIWILLCDLMLAIAGFLTRRGENSFLGFCKEFSFSTAFTLCSQGVLGPSKLSSSRIIFLMMFIVPGVIFPGYSAVLTSFLTVRLDKKPFRSLEELSLTNEYKLGWHNTFPLEHMFNLKDMSPVNQALLHNNVLPQDKLPATDAEGVERMCTEKFSFLTIKDTILALKPKCRYYTLRQHFRLVFTSIEMKKNSWYKYFVDRCERLMEFSGVLYRLKIHSVMKYVKYDQYFISENSGVPPIEIENIVLPFAMLLLGIIASVILLFFEIVCFKLKSTEKPTEEEFPVFIMCIDKMLLMFFKIFAYYMYITADLPEARFQIL